MTFFFLGVPHRFNGFGDGCDGAAEYPGYFPKISVGMFIKISFKHFRINFSEILFARLVLEITLFFQHFLPSTERRRTDAEGFSRFSVGVSGQKIFYSMFT